MVRRALIFAHYDVNSTGLSQEETVLGSFGVFCIVCFQELQAIPHLRPPTVHISVTSLVEIPGGFICRLFC